MIENVMYWLYELCFDIGKLVIWIMWIVFIFQGGELMTEKIVLEWGF